MTDFPPTPEQLRAKELFDTGQSLAIEAGAGTGKTATLILLAESAPERRGQYLAFNKAIVTEAGAKMPSSVNCNTAHSLAFRAVGKRYAHRLKSPRMRSIDIANRLGLNSIRLTTFDGSSKTVARGFLAGLAMRAVVRFCQTADPEPTRRHVPWVEGLDAPAGNGRRETRVRTCNDEIARAIEPALRTAWADLSDPGGSLPFRHDHYLKLYQLSNPRIDVDYILFDEAQDASPVMVAIVAAQTHAQVVWVGDSQQEIYGFTGAINALASVPSDHRAFLTKSFRFGPPIADVANEILALIPGAELRLTGTDAVASVVEAVEGPAAILTRTNATAMRAVMDAVERRVAVYLMGGGKEIVAFTRAAERLMRREHVEHPELACFDSWSEVQEYVEQDEQGSELRLLVTLIDDFGTARIIAALDSCAREQDADLVISTAHKAKGCEWTSVQLAGDFTKVVDGEEFLREGDEERRLLYVAVTRARERLDITNVGALRREDLDVETAPLAAPSETAVGLGCFLRGEGIDREAIWIALGGTAETAAASLDPTARVGLEHARRLYGLDRRR